jgi:hypothetical protein
MEAHELPFLEKIFTDLRKGRHICMEDGPVYEVLASHKDAFQNLFTALGLNLVFHDRGFFYLDDDTAPRSAKRMVLFAAILVETLDDKGVNLDEDLTSVVILPNKLPHLKHEKYAKAMAEVEVASEESLLKVLDTLKRYGFAESREDGSWRFRSSAYRLLDVLNLAGRMIKGEDKADSKTETKDGLKAEPVSTEAVASEEVVRVDS